MTSSGGAPVTLRVINWSPVPLPAVAVIDTSSPSDAVTVSGALMPIALIGMARCLVRPGRLIIDDSGVCLPAVKLLLLVAQGVDRMESGRANCGQETEDDPHGGAEHQPDHRPLHRHVHVEVGEEGDDVSQPE